MNEWLLHMGVSAGILTAFITGYYLLLKKNTYFSFRRGFLLASMILALIIPFGQIPLSTAWQVSLPETLIFQEGTTQAPLPEISPTSPEKSWDTLTLLTWVYVGGCVFMLVRLCVLLFQVFQVVLKSSALAPTDHRVRISERIQAPFSFLWYILLPTQHEDTSDREFILTHEKVHIQKKHFLDLLLMELLLCVQWMNPALWVCKRELKEVHEYEADQEVLHTLTHKKPYQMAVLKYAVGNQKFALASAFNQLQTLKRIHMMNKQRSTTKSRLKTLGIIPISIICLLLNSAFRPETTLNIHYQDEISISGLVLDADTRQPIIGATILLKSSNMGSLTDKKGNFSITISENSSKVLVITSPENASYEIAITQSGTLQILLNKTSSQHSHFFTAGKIAEVPSLEDLMAEPFEDIPPRVILDGDEATVEILKKLDPDKIASVDVLKGEKAIEKFGEKGKYGVIVVTTKEAQKLSILPSTAEKEFSPLIILDGKEVSPGSELSKIDPDDIATVVVIKDEAAIKKYGEKGRNGVVEITSKNK